LQRYFLTGWEEWVPLKQFLQSISGNVFMDDQALEAAESHLGRQIETGEFEPPPAHLLPE